MKIMWTSGRITFLGMGVTAVFRDQQGVRVAESRVSQERALEDGIGGPV